MHNVLFPLTYLGLEPFLIVLARALQVELGFNPTYLAVTPAEALFARNNLTAESLVVELGRKVQDAERIRLHDTPVHQAYDFMQAKYGGTDRVWRRRVNMLFEVVERVILARKISALVLWNGNDCLGRVCKILANKHQLKVVYLENGYFPNTLQIDPQGVNAQASIRNMPFLFQQHRARGNEVTGFDAVYPSEVVPLSHLQRLRLKLGSVIDTGYFDTYPELRDQRFQKKIKTTLSLSTSRAVLETKKPFALIVLQVHDDTQILLNSPMFRSPSEFASHCYESIRKVLGDSFHIAIKLHPADMNRICYGELASTFKGVSWIGSEPVEPLLDACSFVMVINSSVGLQSIAAGKKTLVFGDSFYSRSEVCRVVTSRDQTCEVLAQIQATTSVVDSRNVDDFVSFLRRHFFVPGSWNIKPESNLAPAIHRINSLSCVIDRTSLGR